MTQLPMTLKQFNAQPTIGFNIAEYKPATVDPSIAARSAQLIENREKESRAKLEEYSKSVHEFRNQLHPDEYAAFDSKMQQLNDDIKYQIEFGNTGSAFRMAQNYAVDLYNDRELQNKIRTNADYMSQRAAIQSGSYTNYTKRRWDDLNRYRYDGTGTYTAEFMPTRDFSIVDIWNKAVAATPVRAGGHSSQRGSSGTRFIKDDGSTTSNPMAKDDNGNTVVNKDVVGAYKSTSSQRSSSSSYNAKYKNDIKDIFYDMLKDENIMASIKQEFDTMQWLYNKSMETLNDPNASKTAKDQANADLAVAKEALTDRKGFLYKGNSSDTTTLYNWIEANIDRYADDSKYYNKSTSSSVNTSTTYESGLFGANNQRQKDKQFSPDDGKVNSGSTEITPYNWAQQLTARDDAQYF